MYMLLLSRFSRVRLCVTPWTAAHQAPLSTEFSRQEYWSGLPFPSPVYVYIYIYTYIYIYIGIFIYVCVCMFVYVCLCMHTYTYTCGVPMWLSGKESAYNAGDLASIRGLGRSPGEGNGNPHLYSCLENPMDREAWRATVHRVAKSRTWLKWLSTARTCVCNLTDAGGMCKGFEGGKTGSIQGVEGYVVLVQ